jgi:hypothetical protein
MANTTWNVSDKVSVNLGGTNSLTATSTSFGGVRSIDKLGSGQFYFEYTASTWGASNTSFGIGNINAALTTVMTTPLNAALVYKSGGIWVNNVNSGFVLGALVSGNIIGIAIDLNKRLIWFRLCPSGNWNGNATADPVAGVNGVSIGALFPTPIYALAAFQTSGEVVTANFGDTAFSGALPGGYTSGFTAGLAPVLRGVATQVGVEQWARPGTNVAGQTTQVGVEQWGNAGPNIQGQLTQLAVEEWGSLAVSAGQALITIIAVEEWARVPSTAPIMKPYAMILA